MFLWKEKGTMRHMSWDPWVRRWDGLEASQPYNMLVKSDFLENLEKR